MKKYMKSGLLAGINRAMVFSAAFHIARLFLTADNFIVFLLMVLSGATELFAFYHFGKNNKESVGKYYLTSFITFFVIATTGVSISAACTASQIPQDQVFLLVLSILAYLLASEAVRCGVYFHFYDSIHSEKNGMTRVWASGIAEGLIRGVFAYFLIDFARSPYSSHAHWPIFVLACGFGLISAALFYFMGKKIKPFVLRYYLISFIAFFVIFIVMMFMQPQILPRRETWYGEAIEAICALFLFVGISAGIRIGILAQYTKKTD